VPSDGGGAKEALVAHARDHGQAVPLLLAVVAVGMVALLATGRLVGRWAESARARAAADAAALACLEASSAGRMAAQASAAANGASLARVTFDGASCAVRVTVGGASAVAVAAWRDLTDTELPPIATRGDGG
jgi:hypothetical protein